MRILITGAGGFIGGHLAKQLIDNGHEVYGVDIKEPEFRSTEDIGFQEHEFYIADLRDPVAANSVFAIVQPDWVFALAADMGGMGFIATNDALILRNNLLINLNTIHAAELHGVGRYLFTSSACVYPQHLQMTDDVFPKLAEDDAVPANPQDAYGWEKLVTEKLCESYRDDYGFDVRIVRFHNTYGPYGAWTGGREKAPAALMRKVAESKLRGDSPLCIDVWGDGMATRSYTYVDDTVTGLIMLMRSSHNQPLNLGLRDTVSVDDLAMAIAAEAGDYLRITSIAGPMGVRNRDTDNTLTRAVFDGWEPTISLADGIAMTYPWIEGQVRNAAEKHTHHE